MRIAAAVVSTARRLLDVLLLAVIAAVLVTIVVARIVPALTGSTTLVIAGRSMEPTIPLGSAVVAVPVDPAALRVGDVVSLKVGPDKSTFTHRIERLVTRDGALWIATRGDANATPDPSIVPATSVIGRIDVTIPALGYLITILSTTTGVLFALGLAGSLLAAAWLLEALELDQKAAVRARAARAAAAVDGSAVAAPPAGEPLTYGVPGAQLLERAAVLAIAFGEPMSARTPGAAVAATAPADRTDRTDRATSRPPRFPLPATGSRDRLAS